MVRTAAQELGNLRRYGAQAQEMRSAAWGGTVPLAYARGSAGSGSVGGVAICGGGAPRLKSCEEMRPPSGCGSLNDCPTNEDTYARGSVDLDRIW